MTKREALDHRSPGRSHGPQARKPAADAPHSALASRLGNRGFSEWLGERLGGEQPALPSPVAGAVREGFPASLGPGRALDRPARASFEPLLGHDLGGVRIHDDAAGAGLAGSLGARAAALGSHIVFGAGRYEPRAPSGRHLLARELAHAVQMGHLSPSLAAPYTAPDSALERDADASATLSAQGLPAAPRARAHAPVRHVPTASRPRRSARPRPTTASAPPKLCPR